MYGIKSTGNVLWSYNAATHAYSVVHDFAPDLPAGHHLWQMSRSMDDNVFAFTQRNAADYGVGFLVYRRSTNQVIYRRATTEIDEVQIDKSGRYLVYKTGRPGQGVVDVEIIDLLDGSVELLTDGAPDYAPGHSDNGNGNIVGSEDNLNRILFRNLATPHNFKVLLNLNNMWDNERHISQLMDDESWTLAVFNGASASGLFRRELVQIATDQSQRVRRLAHHRSVYADYDDTALANISRDGRFIAFTSNWGGRVRNDLFIVKSPPIQPGVQPGSWGDIANATANASGGITKNSGGAWYGTANSLQTITAGEGFIACVINDNGSPNRYTLNVGLNTGTTSSVEFYWGVSSGSAHAYVNGQYKADTPVTTADTLKIAVEAGVVKFYKNTALIHASTAAPTYPLKGYWFSSYDGAGLTSASMAGN